jgi:hypothetical protein
MTRRKKASQPEQNFTALLSCLVAETSGDTVTLGQLMRIMERRSFGAVILLLGVIAISPLTVVPGATWTVAAVTLLFSAQLLVGMQHPWLPKALLDMKMPRDQLQAVVEASRKMAHTADKLTEPRLRFLTRPPFVLGVALLCIAAALVTFPLGLIPLAPVLPGVAIVLMGIGLTARDGVFLILSTLAMAGSVMLLAKLLL